MVPAESHKLYHADSSAAPATISSIKFVGSIATLHRLKVMMKTKSCNVSQLPSVE